MSRVGNRPIKINPGVTLEIKDGQALLKSAKGELNVKIPAEIEVKNLGDYLTVTRNSNTITARSQHGLVARLIQNAIVGLSDGIKKVLEFKGTGYRAKVEDGKLVLAMGYSHDIELPVPDGVEVAVVKNTITVSGYDAAKVGNYAATVREVRPPEVYKGKGIKYATEEIRRKDGKVASGGKG